MLFFDLLNCPRRILPLAFLLSLGASATRASAQAAPPPEAPAPEAAPQTTPAPHGKILFERHDSPAPIGDAPAGSPPDASPAGEPATPPVDSRVDVSDRERAALLFTAYDLDLRLQLVQSGVEARARVTVRNRSTEPLRELPLQISSSLHWESATLINGANRTALPVVQHRLQTDADHTGAATEAVLNLPQPLAPGAEAVLDLFYAGTLAQSNGRLERLGASAAQGSSADWDGISPEWTGLRGFGNVLWYPVASPQLFLADGNTLFEAVQQARAAERASSIALRLSVTYQGQAPSSVYFCGRHADLHAVSDEPDAPVALGQGIATAEFSAAPIGFRAPSLFVLQQPEVLLGSSEPGEKGSPQPVVAAPPFSSSASADPEANKPLLPRVPALQPDQALIALSSSDPGASPGLGSAASRAGQLLAPWLGPRPLSLLTVVDHAGQPYQDGPLLVAPAATLETSPEQPAMVYSLTHSWVQTGQPWMDEGLAQFFALLSVEQEHGRDAALDQLNGLMQPVAVVEPDLTPADQAKAGQPIVTAIDETFYRRKAAAVWWMLRDLTGQTALGESLRAWCTQTVSTASATEQAVAFEHLLEKRSGKELSWFFSDWVLRDRGLPDLVIADTQVSRPPSTPGHTGGYLVAVTVRNEGAAVADVPVVVRSGQFTTTERIRVPGFGQATERVLTEAVPTEVQVNDGSVPEQRASKHTRTLAAPAP